MEYIYDEELVSVIVPVYNVEPYLCRCLDSIINQTYTNIEIILIDDGSTDNSYSICREYEEQHSNIVFLHKENGGLSSSRNVGMLYANGLYIMFVDSDDFIHEDCVRELYFLLKNNNVKISQCNFEKGSSDQFSQKNEKIKNTFYSGYKMYETKYVNSVVWGKLYDRIVLKDLEFPVSKINEDEFYTYKVLYAAEKVAVTNRRLYYYYKRSNSIMNNKEKEIELDIIDAFEERINFFDNKNEMKLKIVSIKEFCIRLIVLYTRCMSAKNERNDLEYIKKLFDENYAIIKKESFLSLKEKYLFIAFKYAPNFIEKIMIMLDKG